VRDYEIVDTNAENIGACGFCGHKPGRTERHRRKCDWLKKRYAEDLRFKVLRSREFGDIGIIVSIIHNGRLIVERPVSATRFTNIMLKRGTRRGMPIS
jgi:hypothetical protein